MANLKEGNRLQLAGLLGAPLVTCLLLQVGMDLAIEYIDIAVSLGLTALATGVLVAFGDVVPQKWKHRLVFLRWDNELPGHRSDKLCQADCRIERQQLQSRWPHVFGEDVPTEDRNALWYRHIYRPVQDMPEVMSAHQKFLLYRDATAGSAVILALLSAWILTGFDIPHLGQLDERAFAIEAAALVIWIICAQSNGNRMVTNAVATHLKSEES